jgi:hypothetical protein
MKNILKLITLMVATFLVTVSCDYDENNFEALTNETDPSASFFVQFKNGSKSLLTGVDETGNLVDINSTVQVGLLGLPQGQDISIALNVDPSTTIGPSMYELSETSVTIPAGESFGSVDFTAFASEMPQNETLKFVLNMDAGSNNAPSGLQLEYVLFRICAMDPTSIVGDWVLNMQDSWGDGWNGASVTAIIDGVGTDYTIGGASGSEIITVPDGSQTLSFEFNSGDWDGEVTFQIIAPNGNQAGSGGPSPAVGEVIIDACVL